MTEKSLGAGIPSHILEAEIIKTRKIYEDLYNNSPDMLITTDIQTGYFLNCNHTFLKELGYEKEEVVGKLKREDIFHPDHFEQSSQLINDLLKDGYLLNREIVIKRKDGSALYVSVSTNPLYDEQGKFIKTQTALRNINELVRARNAAKCYQEEVLAYSEDLKRINKNLDLFAYAASHDLRSPLRAISMFSQLSLEHYHNKEYEKLEPSLLQIVSRVNKMDKLLKDMLYFFRSYSYSEKPEEIDVHSMIIDIVNFLDRPDSLKIHIPASLPTIKSYRVPLYQIFLNLINNAIKHHHQPDQGNIEIIFEDQNDEIYFSVIDDGPGIPSEYHHTIFQMFKTVPDNASDSMGMGLALVKGLIERYDGRIEFCSQEKKGSCFKFSWPKKMLEKHRMSIP